MEKGLYAQVVIFCQKALKITEANENKKEAKFKFQDQSARSQSWFGLDFYRIEEIFNTREPDFYRKIFQRHDETKDTNTFKMLEVPIRNSKCVEKLSFTVSSQCSSIVKIH